MVTSKDRLLKNPKNCMKDSKHNGNEPCAIFIGVFCETPTCTYSLKVYSEGSGFHLLQNGKPQSNSVGYQKTNSYFVPIQNIEDDKIYISITNTKGDTKIFVKSQDLHQDQDKWKAPNENKNEFQPEQQAGDSSLIHISPEDAKKACQAKKQCGLLISVVGSKKLESERNDYVIKVFTNLARLIENSPQIAKVEKGKYAYFDFYNGCEKCTLLITVQTFSTKSDVDLYINQGTLKAFPSSTKFDIKSEEWTSESVEISKDHEFFKQKKKASMRSIFVIGVYGVTDSLFTLEINVIKGGIQDMKLYISPWIYQEPNTVKYFKFWNSENEPLKLKIFEKKGSVNVLATTYIKNKDNQTEQTQLPKEENAIWRYDPKSQDKLEISEIPQTYCTNCFYFFSVTSSDLPSQYYYDF